MYMYMFTRTHAHTHRHTHPYTPPHTPNTHTTHTHGVATNLRMELPATLAWNLNNWWLVCPSLTCRLSKGSSSCTSVCMYIHTYVCMYECMYVCMYVCMLYVHTYIGIYVVCLCVYHIHTHGHTHKPGSSSRAVSAALLFCSRLSPVLTDASRSPMSVERMAASSHL